MEHAAEKFIFSDYAFCYTEATKETRVCFYLFLQKEMLKAQVVMTVAQMIPH